MNFLAFDTTHSYLVACAKIEGRQAVHEDDSPLRHSATLMPAVERLLGKGTKPDAIGVCVGPGSFTGIRIGVTTAKMLAYAWEIPVVSFTSTELAAGDEASAISVTDGGNGVWYVGEYRNGVLIGEIRMYDRDGLNAVLDAAPKDAVVIGAACENRACKMPDRSAAAVAALVERKLARGEITDARRVEPVYVQLSQAEKEHAR